MGAQAIDYNAVPFGRGAFRTYGKDNDYTYYKFFKTRPKDGSHPEKTPWHYCVRQGVIGIQRLLEEQWGYSQTETGVYGRATRRNIIDFQSGHNLINEGITGPFTLQVLMKPVIGDVAAGYEIEPQFLHAFASLESGYDTGAQGVDHPTDLGLFQHNVGDTDTADTQAWDPFISAQLAGKRFEVALKKYHGKGPDLKLACAIAQHNWPEGADIWFATGQPPTPTLAEYVSLVMDRAETW